MTLCKDSSVKSLLLLFRQPVSGEPFNSNLSCCNSLLSSAFFSSPNTLKAYIMGLLDPAARALADIQSVFDHATMIRGLAY